LKTGVAGYKDEIPKGKSQEPSLSIVADKTRMP
jgi:hypothetical protein